MDSMDKIPVAPGRRVAGCCKHGNEPPGCITYKKSSWLAEVLVVLTRFHGVGWLITVKWNFTNRTWNIDSGLFKYRECAFPGRQPAKELLRMLREMLCGLRDSSEENLKASHSLHAVADTIDSVIWKHHATRLLCFPFDVYMNVR